MTEGAERLDPGEQMRLVEESISGLFVLAVPAMALRLASGESGASDFNALIAMSQKWTDIKRSMAAATGGDAPKAIEIMVVRPGNNCPSCGELLPSHTPIKGSDA